MNDNQLLNITEKDVTEYRDIYYELVKPILNQYCELSEKGSIRIDHEKMNKEIDQAIINFGWPLEKFKLFQMIDLRQRFSRWDLGPKVNFVGGVDLITASQIPELKCPIRTTDKS